MLITIQNTEMIFYNKQWCRVGMLITNSRFERFNPQNPSERLPNLGEEWGKIGDWAMFYFTAAIIFSFILYNLISSLHTQEYCISFWIWMFEFQYSHIPESSFSYRFVTDNNFKSGTAWWISLYSSPSVQAQECAYIFLSPFVDYLSDEYVHISRLCFCPAFYHVLMKV